MFLIFVYFAIITQVICGPDSRIINGSDAQPGQFPYMVQLQYDDGLFLCGATILTDFWILTSAKCCESTVFYHSFANKTATTGSIYLSSGGTTTPLAYTVTHPDFNDQLDVFPRRRTTDICLARLQDAVVWGEEVQPVVLPPENLVLNPGDNLSVPGWGTTDPDDTTVPIFHPDRLQVGEGYVVQPSDFCLSKAPVLTVLDETYGCALAADSHGTCFGDEGSPVLLNSVQVGVVAIPSLPCDADPTFYTLLSPFLPWIHDVLGDEAPKLRIASN